MTHTLFHDHVKLGDHHDHHQLQLFNEKTQASSSTISSQFVSYSNVQDQGSYYPREENQQIYKQQEGERVASKDGSLDDHGLKLCLWKIENRESTQISSHSYENIPTKWLPSKLRLVRRMMGSNRTASEAQPKPRIKLQNYNEEGSSSPIEASQNSSNYSSSIPIRVCSDCNTTKTPLWRSGPRGPKSLCNACGIRQRKARRAMAAAAAANDTTMVSEVSTLKPQIRKVQQKEKRFKKSTQIAQCKKSSKHKNKCFEKFLINISKNLAFHKVFPQDEKEAAILLMALSSGLVHG